MAVRASAPHAPTGLTFAVVIAAASLALAAPSSGCSAIQPEVGERLSACVDADSNPDPKARVSFKDQIRPIMDGRVPGPRACSDCHYRSRGSMTGITGPGLDLETLIDLKKGGRRSANQTVVAGQPCKSVIVQKLRGTFEGARMPLGGPYWTPDQIQLMSDWIFEGAEGMDGD